MHNQAWDETAEKPVFTPIIVKDCELKKIEIAPDFLMLATGSSYENLPDHCIFPLYTPLSPDINA